MTTGFLNLFSVVGIMFYGLPFFFDFWVEDFGWSRATVTSGLVFGKIIVGPLLGYASGWIIDRAGPRPLMIFGVLSAGFAVIGLGFMEHLWQFYLFYFFVAVGYICGGPLPVQVLISSWFNNSRGRAMGIVYLGIGVGGMLVPHIASGLNNEFDWRGALVVLGSLMMVVALPMIFLVKGGPPVEKDVRLNAVVRPSIRAVLKSRSFYLLAIGSMCSIGAVAGVSQNLKLFFSLDLAFSQQHAANIISLVLGSSIVGRLLMGWLADKYSKRHVMVLIYSLITMSILVLNFFEHSAAVFVFAVIFGIGLGGEYLIIPLMAAELFGVAVLGRVMGLVLTLDGMAEAICPTLAGWMRDRGDSYTAGFTVLIVLSVIGTVAILLLPGGNLRSRDQSLEPVVSA